MKKIFRLFKVINLSESNLIKFTEFLLNIGFWGILIFTVTFLYQGNLNIFSNYDSNKLISFGNFIGGVIGTIFTLSATFLIWLTYKTQREELRKTIQIAENQSNILSVQKFENTFFNMLNSLQAIVNNMVSPNGQKNGRNYLHELFEGFELKVINDSTFKSLKLVIDNNSATKLENTVICFYDNLFKGHSYNLGHYFRSVHNILKYINSELNNNILKEKYSSILQSQLSNDELGFIFYNSLSKYSLDKESKPKFREMVDQLNILENINEKCVFDSSLILNFPKTNFYFSRENVV